MSRDPVLMSKLCLTIEDGYKILTQRDALDFIGRRGTNVEHDAEVRIKNAKDVLNKELFPHTGLTEDSMPLKAFFLGYMTNRLLQVLVGRADADDRDNYINKALETSGPLLAGLLYQLVKKICNEIRNSVQKFLDEGRPINVAACVKQKIITQKFRCVLFDFGG